jgi:hypothetical protein
LFYILFPVEILSLKFDAAGGFNTQNEMDRY